MGIRLIKIGIIYLLLGMGVGVYMGASGDHTLRPVHAHINLLGWTLMGLSGLIFHLFPQLELSALARIYFWLYNISVPVALIGLFLFLSGFDVPEPVLAGSSVLITVSAACFAWLVFTKLPQGKTN